MTDPDDLLAYIRKHGLRWRAQREAILRIIADEAPSDMLRVLGTAIQAIINRTPDAHHVRIAEEFSASLLHAVRLELQFPPSERIPD